MSEFLLFYLFIIVFVVLISWLACLLKIIPGAWYIILLGSNHARRTHTKHPSSAVGERSEPHAFSNAHVPCTLRAQSASKANPTRFPAHTIAPFERRSEPHAFPNAHIPSTLRTQKRAPCVIQRTHTKHTSSAGGEQVLRVFKRTHTDHLSSAGGRAKGAPRQSVPPVTPLSTLKMV